MLQQPKCWNTNLKNKTTELPKPRGAEVRKTRGKAARNQSPSRQDRDSLIPTMLPVTFSTFHAMLGSKTANQCPGELFMPALSLIHLYYSDR